MTSATLPDLIRPSIISHLEGRRDEARKIYKELLPLINFENRQCGWRSTKAVMQAGNVFKSDYVRHPTRPLHPSTKAELLELAREANPIALNWGL
jgi:4-hydroxy-tetrahydrodipicolinate synthase